MAVAAPPQTFEDDEVQDILQLPKRSYWQDAWDRLKRNKAAILGMVIIAFFVLLSVFANVVAPRNPLEQNSGKQFLPPVFVGTYQTKQADPRFIFGTDYLGRDVLSRVIYGSRVSLFAGLLPTIVIVFIGVSVGVIAGFIGGMTDNLMMRFTDIFYAFPDLLFFIILIIALKDTPIGDWLSGLFVLFMALAITGWVGMARSGARLGAVVEGKGIHRGRPRHRGADQPHHVPAHPAQCAGAHYHHDRLHHPAFYHS